MQSIVVDLLYGLTTAVIGAAAASWLCLSRPGQRTVARAGAEADHAAQILVRLQELACRVAFDVDEHSSRVEQINDELTSASAQEPAMIVDVVTRLIHANQQMHEKLASTEDRLREQAQEIQTHAAQARTDVLTLLANRRAFEEELARRLAEFHRQGRIFSLLMADVDHFKRFNDAHGHQVGDEVLRNVAKLLRRKMREMDLVARYGGEEFAIILPGTSLADACKAAVRACEGIEESRYRQAGRELQVTASLGIAEVHGNEDAAALIARADKALYAAKEGGRNCAYWHDGQSVYRVVPLKRPEIPPAESQQAPPPPGNPERHEGAPPVAGAVPAEPKSEAACSLDLGMLSNYASRTSFCQQVRNRTAEWKRGGPIFSVVLIELNLRQADGQRPCPQTRNVATLAVTRFLAATVGGTDVVAHYAPHCFAVLLPAADLAGAIGVAERLEEQISEYRSPGEGGKPILAASIAVVQVMKKDDSISVLKRAEATLEEADRHVAKGAYYHDGERIAPVTARRESLACAER
jgi:diguanylate cyclase